MKDKNAKRILYILRFFFNYCTWVALPLGLALGTHAGMFLPGMAFGALCAMPYWLLRCMSSAYGEKIDPQWLQKPIFRLKRATCSAEENADSSSAPFELTAPPLSPAKRTLLKIIIWLMDILVFILFGGMVYLCAWFVIHWEDPGRLYLGYSIALAYGAYCSIIIFWPAAYLLYRSARLEKRIELAQEAVAPTPRQPKKMKRRAAKRKKTRDADNNIFDPKDYRNDSRDER